MIETRTYLISHHPNKPRDVYYHWGSWPGETTQSGDGDVKGMMALFKKREIKWYCIFSQTIDTDTGLITFKVLDNNAHEDIPPLELNVVAKGFVPPPEAPKKPKVSGLGLPPSFFQEMPKLSPKAKANMYGLAPVAVQDDFIDEGPNA